MPNPLQRFSDQHTVMLTTFRRDGTPVGTPVSIAVDGDHAYFRSWTTAWKTRRIRHNPSVTIAPSTFRGRVTGDAIAAEAHLIEGEQEERARELLGRKHPVLHRILVPLIHRVQHRKTVHFEVVAA